MIYRIIAQDPKITWKNFYKATGADLSISSLRRLIKDLSIDHWRAKKRLGLLKHHAEDRLKWALQHQNTDWKNWIISDECSVQPDAGRLLHWSFGFKARDAFKPTNIETYSKAKLESAMVWSDIRFNGRLPLISMTRDELSPKNGYSAQSYQEALEECLIPYYDSEVFEQDGAGIHRSRQIKSQFRETGVFVHNQWPLYSPDLNPVEQAWVHLKRIVHELCPALNEPRGMELQLKLLRENLPKAQSLISEEVNKALIESMPARIEAVIKAEGWCTRY